MSTTVHSDPRPTLTHLRSGGASVLPEHADGLLPEHARAWIGRRGIEGSRQGRDWSPAFRTTVGPERHEGRGHQRDLTSCSEERLEQVAGWVRLQRRHRGLLHAGAVVNGDHHDDATWMHGVVAQDASEALFHVVPWAVGGVVLPGRVLAEVGLPVQPMLPEHSQLWRVRKGQG